MVQSFLIGMLIIAIAIALLSIKVIVKKDGRMSSQHIHDSGAMNARGIHCAIDQDREARLNDKAY